MEDTYVQLINCRPHLFRSSASSFSSQYLLLYLKSSRSCVLLLPTPFISDLSFNVIMEEAISSLNMTNTIGFSTQDVIQKCPLLYYSYVQELVHQLLLLTILSSSFSPSITFQYQYQIPRERFQPEPGFEPRTFSSIVLQKLRYLS